MADADPDPAAVERLMRIGGDTLVRQMIELFLQLGPGRAVELARGVESADVGRVERVAHTFKSAAGNVGAMRLQENAAALEERAGAGVIDAALARRVQESWEESAAALRSILERLSE